MAIGGDAASASATVSPALSWGRIAEITAWRAEPSAWVALMFVCSGTLAPLYSPVSDVLAGKAPLANTWPKVMGMAVCATPALSTRYTLVRIAPVSAGGWTGSIGAIGGTGLVPPGSVIWGPPLVKTPAVEGAEALPLPLSPQADSISALMPAASMILPLAYKYCEFMISAQCLSVYNIALKISLRQHIYFR